MSVFVESSQRFAGLVRRTAAFRATGSTTGRCVRERVPLAMHRRADPEDANSIEAPAGQRVGDRLDERRELVGRVVVDEDDLVVGVGEDLGEAVEAERGAAVEVVAVRVVAAVEDERDHRSVAVLAARPCAPRVAASATASGRPAVSSS